MTSFIVLTIPLLLVIAIASPPVLPGNISAIRENANIRWVQATSSSDVIFRRPDPAGFESQRIIYVCRTIPVNNLARPGKIAAVDNEIYCSVAEAGNEIRYNEFEMLEAPLGSTSWETYIGGTVPENAIVAGLLGNGNLTYVCRAKYYGHVLVGYLASTGNCLATFGPREFILPDNKEILVLNVYGQVI